ncbi:oxidoreductase [Arboricoccus pini]|nr:oxidoreductase [Arboricoccus pini]
MVETARIQEEIPGHLVIRGAIDAALGGETIYELPRLQQLPSVSFKTITPWTTGAHTFKGVNLKTLMAAVGARGSIVRATALNDYAITIDLSDSAASLAIVAYEEDGQPIRVRDKGPLWILFPFSDHPELLTDRVEGWSIWQLDAIEVLAP